MCDQTRPQKETCVGMARKPGVVRLAITVNEHWQLINVADSTPTHCMHDQVKKILRRKDTLQAVSSNIFLTKDLELRARL